MFIISTNLPNSRLHLLSRNSNHEFTLTTITSTTVKSPAFLGFSFTHSLSTCFFPHPRPHTMCVISPISETPMFIYRLAIQIKNLHSPPSHPTVKSPPFPPISLTHSLSICFFPHPRPHTICVISTDLRNSNVHLSSRNSNHELHSRPPHPTIKSPPFLPISLTNSVSGSST